MKNLITQTLILSVSLFGMIYCYTHVNENHLFSPMSTIICLIGMIALKLHDND